MAKGITGRGSDQFMVRLPEGMRDRIAEAARANGRSMNAEIVARLEFTFEALRQGGPGLFGATALVGATQETLSAVQALLEENKALQAENRRLIELGLQAAKGRDSTPTPE